MIVGNVYGPISHAALGGCHARNTGIAALVDFDIADQEDEPIMLTHVEWDQVKVFFRSQARRLGQEWFGQE